MAHQRCRQTGVESLLRGYRPTEGRSLARVEASPDLESPSEGVKSSRPEGLVYGGPRRGAAGCTSRRRLAATIVAIPSGVPAAIVPVAGVAVGGASTEGGVGAGRPRGRCQSSGARGSGGKGLRRRRLFILHVHLGKL